MAYSHKLCASSYFRQGCCNPPRETSDEIIGKLRESLDTEFAAKGNPRELFLHEMNSSEIIRSIINLYSSPSLLEVLDTISEERLGSKGKVYILPGLYVMRNYFSSPINGNHGWHYDCGSEMNHKFCTDRLKDKDYVFGKIGFFLQENRAYGGGIDIVRASHKAIRFRERGFRDLLAKLSLYLISRISSIEKLRALSLLGFNYSELIPNKITVRLEPGQPFLFDSGIIHRSTPINQNQIPASATKDLKNYHYKGDLGIHNKYVIYSHFGNYLGVESHLFDRTKRKGHTEEMDLWLLQMKTSFTGIALRDESLRMLEKVKEEYL